MLDITSSGALYARADDSAHFTPFPVNPFPDALSPSDAAARVARGAEHLDAVRPGWAFRIDCRRLDITSPACCVIGQLADTKDVPSFFESAFRYWVECAERVLPDLPTSVLGRSDVLAREGFWIPTGGVGEVLVGYGRLRAAWIDAIDARTAPITIYTVPERELVGV